MFDIKIDTGGLDELRRDLARLSRTAVPRARQQALNRAAVSVQAAAHKALAKETGLSQKDAKSALSLKKANRNSGRAILSGRSRPVNLIRFMTPAQKKSALAGKRGRAVRVGTAKKAPWGKSRTYRRKVFVGNAGRTLFIREGDGRLPIRPMFGPSIARELVREAVFNAMDARFAERFDIELERTYNNELRKLGFR